MVTMDDAFQNDLRRILREEVRPMLHDEIRPILHEEIRPIVREEVRPLVRKELKAAIDEEIRPLVREELAVAIDKQVRPLIREETQDMRNGIAELKNMVGTQGMQLSNLQADMGTMKSTMRYQVSETHRLDVLLEDLNDRFAAARELRWD
ncbi:MAG: hypothetical protein JWN82_144 [Candidatus Saccharibacteria bacterium]|nr:hypothetical protein [Candidatus Saccharibacteria bacterium]